MNNKSKNTPKNEMPKTEIGTLFDTLSQDESIIKNNTISHIKRADGVIQYSLTKFINDDYLKIGWDKERGKKRNQYTSFRHSDKYKRKEKKIRLTIETNDNDTKKTLINKGGSQSENSYENVISFNSPADISAAAHDIISLLPPKDTPPEIIKLTSKIIGCSKICQNKTGELELLFPGFFREHATLNQYRKLREAVNITGKYTSLCPNP